MGGDHGIPVTVSASLAFLEHQKDASLLLVGRESELKAALPPRLLRRPGLARDFTQIGLTMRGVVDLLNQPAVLPEQMRDFLGRVGTVNVDDKPVLEFSTARNLFELAKE